jgi:hypothetical protein
MEMGSLTRTRNTSSKPAKRPREERKKLALKSLAIMQTGKALIVARF